MSTRTAMATTVVTAAGVLALGYTTIAALGARPSQEAEGFQWFWTLDGPVGSDAGSEIVTDEDGNIFIAGATAGLDLDRDGTLDLTADIAEVLFLKVREVPESGRVTVDWIRSPVSPGVNTGSGVAVDRRGGVYGIGRFQQSVEFGKELTLPGRGLNDGFIVRYDPDGEVLWARTIGGPGQDAPTDVASDSDGNAYVVGWGEGTFPLDDRGAEFRGGDEMAGLIVSYDPDGSVRWVHAVPAPNRILFGVEVSPDPDGEVFVTGELEDGDDFDGDGRVDLPASRDRDGFVDRFDVDGALLGAWATPAPGKVAFLRNGDLLLASATGGQAEERYGPADFDGDGKPDVEPKDGPSSAWVARYGREGTLRWVRSYAMDMPADIESDGERFVISGGYNGIRDLDEDGIPERVDHRSEQERFNTEMAVLLLSGEDGHPERAWTAPGPGKDHAAAALFMPDRRTLYVTGSLQYTADFTGDGVNGEGWVECESLGDFFFAQYRLPELRQVAARREITLSASVSLPGRAPRRPPSTCTEKAFSWRRWITRGRTPIRFPPG
ncbi:MAG: SBBP repeat-containing protein [Gemmatimonadales bacterium]